MTWKLHWSDKERQMHGEITMSQDFVPKEKKKSVIVKTNG